MPTCFLTGTRSTEPLVAVSTSVLGRQLMFVHAVGSRHALAVRRVRRCKRVLTARRELHVRRVDASPVKAGHSTRACRVDVVADVVDREAVGNWSVYKLPRPTMRSSGDTAGPPVSVPVDQTTPRPAVVAAQVFRPTEEPAGVQARPGELVERPCGLGFLETRPAKATSVMKAKVPALNALDPLSHISKCNPSFAMTVS